MNVFALVSMKESPLEVKGEGSRIGVLHIMQPMNCPGRWFILERHPRASGDTPEGRVKSSEPFDDTAGDGSDAHFFEFKRGINPRG